MARRWDQRGYSRHQLEGSHDSVLRLTLPDLYTRRRREDRDEEVAGVSSTESESGWKVDAAHALVTENSDGSLRISVRAPLSDLRGADILCRHFPTGGGRAGAAGINALPAEMLDSFLSAFHQIYR